MSQFSVEISANVRVKICEYEINEYVDFIIMNTTIKFSQHSQCASLRSISKHKLTVSSDISDYREEPPSGRGGQDLNKHFF